MKVNGYKTYGIAAVSVLYAVAQWWTGGLSAVAAVQMVEVALLAAGIRNGMQK